jgi:hypothetical protein
MAKAKRLAREAPKHAVRLDLTEEEAKTLVAMLRATSGDPIDSRRKHADKMMSALDAAGLDTTNSDLDGEHKGTIMFFTPVEMAWRL